MATIRREFILKAAPEAAWAKLRDFGACDRLAPGFVTACEPEEGGSVRRLTFANGLVARERRVTIDDAERLVVYASEGGRATHHNASAQIVGDAAGGSRFVWITHVLPDELAPAIAQMMDGGALAMKRGIDGAG